VRRSLRFSGRLRNHALPAGKYVLLVSAKRAGAKAAAPVRAKFTVTRR
jgi:hypothetical protein